MSEPHNSQSDITGFFILINQGCTLTASFLKLKNLHIGNLQVLGYLHFSYPAHDPVLSSCRQECHQRLYRADSTQAGDGPSASGHLGDVFLLWPWKLTDLSRDGMALQYPWLSPLLGRTTKHHINEGLTSVVMESINLQQCLSTRINV